MSWIGYAKGAGLATDYVQLPYEIYKTYKLYKAYNRKYRDSWSYRPNRRRTWYGNKYRLNKGYKKYAYKYRARRSNRWAKDASI